MWAGAAERPEGQASISTSWASPEVVELLDQANMEAVVRDFGDRNPQEDPVIHFYEYFLAAYDKHQKVSRGVFYTPRPWSPTSCAVWTNSCGTSSA